MQGPWDDGARGGVARFEQMVNTFADNAQAYWRLSGPLGEPMVQSIAVWAQMQRVYLRWMREASGVGRSRS